MPPPCTTVRTHAVRLSHRGDGRNFQESARVRGSQRAHIVARTVAVNVAVGDRRCSAIANLDAATLHDSAGHTLSDISHWGDGGKFQGSAWELEAAKERT